MDSYGIITRIKPVRPYMAFVSPLKVIRRATANATSKQIADVPPTERYRVREPMHTPAQVVIVDNNTAAGFLPRQREWYGVPLFFLLCCLCMSKLLPQ